jgi:hypothetical protein
MAGQTSRLHDDYTNPNVEPYWLQDEEEDDDK